MCRKIRKLAGNTSQLRRGIRGKRSESLSDGCVEDVKKPKGREGFVANEWQRRMPGAEKRLKGSKSVQ
jgi:hypothetical protein